MTNTKLHVNHHTEQRPLNCKSRKYVLVKNKKMYKHQTVLFSFYLFVQNNVETGTAYFLYANVTIEILSSNNENIAG